jgi:putative phage repressor
MEKNLKSRLIEFIASKDMSIRRFEIECGLPNAYVSNIRNNITSRRLEVITAKFPDLNLQWLMTGEGSMSRNESAEGAGGTNADIERRLSEMNMQLIRMMTEFVRQETKITERYRDCIDRLQEQNEKLSGMMEKMISDEQPNRKHTLGKTVIG